VRRFAVLVVDNATALKVWPFSNSLVVWTAAKLGFLADDYKCKILLFELIEIVSNTNAITFASLLLFLIPSVPLAVSTATESSFIARNTVLFVLGDCLCVTIIAASKSEQMEKLTSRRL
jgi:hypothetical protein